MTGTNSISAQGALHREITDDLSDIDAILAQVDAEQAMAARPKPAPAAFVAPRTLTEQRLAELWSALLQVEQIGIYDDFFALGGHSILATQGLAEIYEIFQVKVPIKVVFAETGFTIAELASAIEECQMEQASDEDIAALLAEIEHLSEEEIKALLESELS